MRGGSFVVRGDHRPPAALGLEEHVHEIRIRNAEQGIDPLGFEQLQNTLVDRYAHDRFHSLKIATRKGRWLKSTSSRVAGNHRILVHIQDDWGLRVNVGSSGPGMPGGGP